MGGVLHNSQILSMAILLRAWTGAAAAFAACAAAPGEAMALRPTARHKKAANNKADSNKSARKGGASAERTVLPPEAPSQPPSRGSS